ncbi:MAG: DUF4317 domain-containing protein [Eubacterium sp.]|nr:DUF4317 domain-containing protein [Eubacterium sp.]
MNKKEVLEIRKQFTPANCAIDRICGCYVDYEKNKVLTSKDAFLSLPEEEEHKYFDIFKKTLGGTVGKNLTTMEFPLEQEQPDGSQEFLLRLRNSKLEDDELLEAFYNKIIDEYFYEENYYIVLIHGNYDVPGKGSDGIEMDDASDTVYEFLLCSICPVTMSKAGLSYDSLTNSMAERVRDWVVQPPINGMLFPAFEDRAADIHKVLYFAKNPEIMQENFISQILGSVPSLTPGGQKDSFHEVLSMTLEQNGDFDTIKMIHENISELVEENKDEEELVMMGKEQVSQLLSNSGVGHEDIEFFEELYDEKVGEREELVLNNIAETKKFQIETPDVVIKVDPERAMMIETMDIDGRHCIVIPAEGNVEVNGVSVSLRKDKGDIE